ncbi:MAG: glycosyltransferase [Hyphomicrobium sp.]
MKILHVSPGFYPATYYGGPIFSTYALCNALARFPDVELRVLTSDMAGPAISQRIPVTDVPLRFPGYDVYVTRRVMRPDIAPGLLSRLWEMVGWADVILLTGIYSFPTIPTLVVSKIQRKPIVLSPRGSLKASHDWADAKRQRLKRAWEAICRAATPSRCLLHVTTNLERDASLARMPGLTARVVSNGVDVPCKLPEREWRPAGLMRLMTLGRLDPVKGLENLLRALPNLGQHVTLDLYGTGDTDYVASLCKLVSDLGVGDRVTFHGHVEDDEKRRAYFGADLLVLPSHTENFSMVVAEALAHGLPAIVSRGAPWEELETKGCGLWVSNEPDVLAEAIVALQDSDLASMGAHGRLWMQSEFSWDSKAREMMGLFEECLTCPPA